MIEAIFGQHQEAITKGLQFVLGKPHKVMGAAYLMVLLNMVMDLIRKPGFFKVLREHLERTFAYTAFIVIANVVDTLAIDNLFGWQGSTQFMVCLYIVARNIRQIADWLTQRFGISIPILNERLNQMEGGQTNATYNWVDPSKQEDVQTRITRLRQELQNLEQTQTELNQAPAPVVTPVPATPPIQESDNIPTI